MTVVNLSSFFLFLFFSFFYRCFSSYLSRSHLFLIYGSLSFSFSCSSQYSGSFNLLFFSAFVFFSLHKSNRLPLSFLNLRLPLFPFVVLLHHALLRFSSSYPRDLPFNYFPSSSVLPYASFALTHSLLSLIYFFSYSCYGLCSSNYSLSFLISHSSLFCLLLSFIRFSLFYLSIFRVCFLNSYDFIFFF